MRLGASSPVTPRLASVLVLLLFAFLFLLTFPHELHIVRHVLHHCLIGRSQSLQAMEGHWPVEMTLLLGSPLRWCSGHIWSPRGQGHPHHSLSRRPSLAFAFRRALASAFATLPSFVGAGLLGWLPTHWRKLRGIDCKCKRRSGRLLTLIATTFVPDFVFRSCRFFPVGFITQILVPALLLVLAVSCCRHWHRRHRIYPPRQHVFGFQQNLLSLQQAITTVLDIDIHPLALQVPPCLK
mmetsp:Transcript_46155/g.109803  ORF Transcript_46155/g.109803 Transcript_46155/m.109803 type:complete len:238 (-) Transcript_46155:1039-1752(-)